MKRGLFLFPVLLAFSGFGQVLSHVAYAGGATFSSFSFRTDQGIIIKISDEGKLIEWGTEWETRRTDYYPGKLQPYMGRVDYYGREADSISRGKVKSIGTCFFTYYGPFETEANIGKIKFLGRTMLDYYPEYENQAFRGKLKTAGPFLISYYSLFENEAFRGKLKSIGNTNISYFSTFDDQAIKGKVKSIGHVNYSWYTSRDRREYQGGLKGGNFIQLINDITYIVR